MRHYYSVRSIRFFAALILAAGAARAQSSAPQAGIESEWDLRRLLDSLSSGTRRLQPLMEQANPRDWDDAQAAAAYASQWQSARNQVRYLGVTAQNLANQPERLTLAIEAYFRLQSIQGAIVSLSEGVRKYRNPALADLLLSALRENVDNRERLKGYLAELAQTKEQELKVMDDEARRCRGTLSKQPALPPKPGRK